MYLRYIIPLVAAVLCLQSAAAQTPDCAAAYDSLTKSQSDVTSTNAKTLAFILVVMMGEKLPDEKRTKYLSEACVPSQFALFDSAQAGLDAAISAADVAQGVCTDGEHLSGAKKLEKSWRDMKEMLSASKGKTQVRCAPYQKSASSP